MPDGVTASESVDDRATAASVESTLTRADSLLETTFLEPASALDQAAADNAPDEPSPTAGPLGVDLVGELAERSRNHGKRLRPTLAHWGWVVGGAEPPRRRTSRTLPPGRRAGPGSPQA